MVCNRNYGGSVAGYGRDIADAQSMGVDGFALNMGDWDDLSANHYAVNTQNMFAAAVLNATAQLTASNPLPPFVLFLSADKTNIADAAIIAIMTQYASHPNYYKKAVVNGSGGTDLRPYLSTWGGEGGTYADVQTRWNTNVLNPLRANGINPFFVPKFFIHWGAADVAGLLTGFADGAFVANTLGAIPPDAGKLDTLADGQLQCANVKQAGLYTLGYISPQYYNVKPMLYGAYYEYHGGLGMRQEWLSIIGNANVDDVELFTWNDFDEATYCSPIDDVTKYWPYTYITTPGFYHQRAATVDALKRYIPWFKTGVAPVITQDTLTYQYRLTPYIPDYAFITTWLTAPATVGFVSGDGIQQTASVPAGWAHTPLPLVAGAQTFTLSRNGIVLSAGAGAVVQHPPYAQDNSIYFEGILSSVPVPVNTIAVGMLAVDGAGDTAGDAAIFGAPTLVGIQPYASLGSANPYGVPFSPAPGVDDGDSLSVTSIVEQGNYWFPKISYGRYSTANGFVPIGKALTASTLTLTAGYSSQNVAISGWSDMATLGTRNLTLAQGQNRFVPVVNSVSWANTVSQSCLVHELLTPLEYGDLPANALLWYYPTNGFRTYAVHRSRYPRTLDVLSDGDALLRRVYHAQDLTHDRLYCEDLGRGLIYGLWPALPLAAAPFGSGNYPAIYVSAETPPTLLCEEIGFVDTDGSIRTRRANPVGITARLVQPDAPIALSVGTVYANVVELFLNGSHLDYGTTVALTYYVQNSFCATENSLGLSLQTYSLAAGSASFSTYARDFVDGVNINPVTSSAKSGFLYLTNGLSAGPYFQPRSGSLYCSTSCPQYDTAYAAGETFTVQGQALDTAGVPIAGITMTLTASGPFTITASSQVSDASGSAYFQCVPTGAGTGTLSLLYNGNTLTSQQITTAGQSRWEPSVFVSLGEEYKFTNASSSSRRIVYVSVQNPDSFPWTGAGQVTLYSNTGGFFNPNGLSDTGLGGRLTISLSEVGPFLQDTGLIAVGYAAVSGDEIRAVLQAQDSRYTSNRVTV